MGSEGWELVGIKEEPREGTPGLNDAATYITYWFMRPINESVRVIEDWIKDLKEKKKQEKPLNRHRFSWATLMVIRIGFAAN